MARSQIVDLRGRAAYEAYCHAVGGRSAISGEELPTWDGQRPDIREAWRAAADAAAMITEMQPAAPSEVTYCADDDCDGHGTEN